MPPAKPDQTAPTTDQSDREHQRRGGRFRLARQSGKYLTTAHGLRIPHTDHSLKAGDRGPSILEDFQLRKKITHFDHERIPERVVHARGAAAHGVFEP
jgi:catalase